MFKSFILLLVSVLSLPAVYHTSVKKESAIVLSYRIENICVLPDELSETSGIITFDSLIWTFNDSGGEAKIFGLNTKTGSITRTLEIKNGKNSDWEDIGQNKEFIFIGDFGNNDGSRKDLRIYMLPKKNITRQQSQTIDALVIDFYYEDQEDYTPAMFASSFDCEAMIATTDSLYLFTKDWINLHTSIYSVPAKAGRFKAKHTGNFNSEGLITGADINSKDQSVVLCGYNLFYPFIIVINDVHQLKEINRVDLEEISGSQIEGVCFINDNRFYVSNENSTEKQSLKRIILNNH